MFAMIDMKISNLQSVLEAFQRIGAPIRHVESPSDLEKAGAIVLPGVGAFGDGMQSLRTQGLVSSILRHVRDGRKPILGICLGMQLLAEESEEFGLHRGLGLIRGRVQQLRPIDRSLRVPNMGWCDIQLTKPDSVLFSGFLHESPTFYFAHSYHLVCEDELDVAAELLYGSPITVAVERDNIFGIQFHPEKSQSAGLDLLDAFRRFVEGNGNS